MKTTDIPQRQLGPITPREFSVMSGGLFCQPWFMAPFAHRDMCARVDVLNGMPPERWGEFFGHAFQLDGMTVDASGIATIPVYGPVGRRIGGLAKLFGGVDFEDIEAELNYAQQSDSVRAVIMDYHSPGGRTVGTPEASARIAGLGKPVISFSQGMMASAAYWMASAADGIYSTQSSDVGYIGTYMVVHDEKDRYEAAGIHVDVITATDLKPAGYPGTSLTPDQRADLQARVIRLNETFKAHVRSNRGDVSDDTLRGQGFEAPEAMERNLIDGIVTGVDDVKQLLLSSI